MHHDVSEPRRFRPDPSVVGQEVDGRLVLVHTGTNEIVQLNATATRFWRLLEDLGDVAEVRRRLLAEYDIEAARLERETASILEHLRAKKLVIPDARPGAANDA